MASKTLVQWTYWGGWASALVAVAYKFAVEFGLCQCVLQVFPRHFWQLSFLLFIICIASYARGRSLAA